MDSVIGSVEAVVARVLVIDDNHDTCELLARLLRRAGHDADCTTSAGDAIDYLGSSRPDLLILDVTMPRMTGLELLKVVRGNPQTTAVPVVLYTAMSDEKTRSEASRLGASGYVVKGRGWVELQAEIEKHIGPARLGRPDPKPQPPPG